MFQFFTFVVYKPKMLGNYTLDYVDNYLTIKYCRVNLVSTFVFTFASSSINVGLLRKEREAWYVSDESDSDRGQMILWHVKK